MTLLASVQEFFLQRRAEAEVARRPHALQMFVAKEVAYASVHLRIARAHPSPNDADAARTLYRTALVHLAEAYRGILANEVPAAPDRAAAVASIASYMRERGEKATDHVILEVVESDATTELSASPTEASAVLEIIDAFCSEFENAIDPRPRGTVRSVRAIRIAALAVASLYIAPMLLGYLWRGGNLARHAHVSVSSQHPGTPDPRGAINGTIEADFGVHTERDKEPWVLLDFGSERTIKQVIVYPRGDGYADESLPLTVEASSDGQAYAVVGTRALPFTQRSPWVLKTTIHGRFLRLRTRAGGYIALSEIEAYAR